MPSIDISRDGMVKYFKDHLQDVDENMSEDEKVKRSITMFSYILEYFDPFVQHFGNTRFFQTVYNKCIEFLENKKIKRDYCHLSILALSLFQKLDKNAQEMTG